MIVEPFVVPAIAATAALGGLSLLLQLIGTTLYDLRQTKAARHYHQLPDARIYRNRPTVSIIIPTENHAAVIERCLDSIHLGSYRKFQIIVIDNCSQDETVNRVEHWEAAHPKRNVRMIANRKPTTYHQRLRTISRRHLQSTLVMVLEPTDVLDSQAITLAVRHLNYQSTVSLLLPKRQMQANLTISGLFERYSGLLSQRRQKWNSVTGANSTTVIRAAIYRLAAFRDILLLQHDLHDSGPLHQLPLRGLRYEYAAEVIVTVAPPASLRALLKHRYQLQAVRFGIWRTQRRPLPNVRRSTKSRWRWLQGLLLASNLVLAALVPCLISYFVYLAIGLHEPLLLGLSAIILAALLLTAIWNDQSLRLRQKLTYISGIPITYGLFYLTACLQLLLVLPAFMSRKKLLSDT